MSVLISASTSSLPDWTGLAAGSDSEGRVLENIPSGSKGLDCSMRLYSRGLYFSKLVSSLLGGGLLDLNVLGWVGDVRYRNGC